MLKIGIIGYGTIGMGTAQILLENKDIIKKRTGTDILLSKVADLDITSPRSYTIPKELLTTDVKEVIENPEIDIVVEAIGGTKPALDFILTALKNNKHVVTPNKEVIAKHGSEIMAVAEENNVDIYYEAAVGGGIPIIRPLKVCLSANNVLGLYGIVNGTTNFILSKMKTEGLDFDVVLKEAQELGYAEADPTADIEGYDSCYKLAILSSIAFGSNIKFEDIHFEGITSISALDNLYAQEFGYEIKLLAIAKQIDGKVELRVHPTMIEKDHPLAQVNGVNNAIFVKGDFVGETMFYGPGAGAEATGSAVVGDIMDIAYSNGKTGRRNLRTNVEAIDIVPKGNIVSEYFTRIDCADETGVLSSIADVFTRHNVSIKSALQKEQTSKGSELVVITHEVAESAMLAALEEIKALNTVYSVNGFIRVGI